MREGISKKQIVVSLLGLAALIAVIAGVMIAQRRQEADALAFGEPLFTHALPQGAETVQQEARRDDAGVMTAAILLRWDGGTAEDLLAFYGDTDYPPFAPGEATRLQARALDEASIETLKRADLYTEGADYWFIWLTSQAAE